MESLEKIDYDTLILGGTLEALIHSYVEGIPLIMVNPQMPFYRDIDPGGLNKSLVWSKLSYYLSYAGLNPLADKAGNYRIEEDNIITVFGKIPYKVQFGYKNVFRYDQIKPTDKLRVLDHINTECLVGEDVDKVGNINTGEDFVGSFYTRINNKINHLIAISSLTQEQVSSEEYGEVYARLKTVEVLKNHGILGRYEDLRDGTKRLHYLKTKTIKREILFDTRESEDAILMERKETQDPRLKKIVDIFGSPYAP